MLVIPYAFFGVCKNKLATADIDERGEEMQPHISFLVGTSFSSVGEYDVDRSEESLKRFEKSCLFGGGEKGKGCLQSVLPSIESREEDQVGTCSAKMLSQEVQRSLSFFVHPYLSVFSGHQSFAQLRLR